MIFMKLKLDSDNLANNNWKLKDHYSNILAKFEDGNIRGSTLKQNNKILHRKVLEFTSQISTLTEQVRKEVGKLSGPAELRNKSPRK